jgi:hypothetical protein
MSTEGSHSYVAEVLKNELLKATGSVSAIRYITLWLPLKRVRIEFTIQGENIADFAAPPKSKVLVTQHNGEVVKMKLLVSSQERGASQ